MTVAIYGRSIEPEFFPYLKRLVEGLERKGVGMVCEEKFAALLSGNYGYEPKFLNCFGRCTLIKEEVELLLSVGGDGTFLDSVIYVKDSGVPVLGVNSGHLGFLANVPVEEIEDAVDFIAAGKYEVEQRDMLQLEVEGQRIADFDYALSFESCYFFFIEDTCLYRRELSYDLLGRRIGGGYSDGVYGLFPEWWRTDCESRMPEYYSDSDLSA